MRPTFRFEVLAPVVAGAVLALTMAIATPRAAVADVSQHAVDAGAACGTKQNPCPLQKWMRTALQEPNASGDMAALASALDRAARLSPDPSWNGPDATYHWDASAKAGAAAARANDAARVKAACKSCHDAWKDKYKDQFRALPLPR